MTIVGVGCRGKHPPSRIEDDARNVDPHMHPGAAALDYPEFEDVVHANVSEPLLVPSLDERIAYGQSGVGGSDGVADTNVWHDGLGAPGNAAPDSSDFLRSMCPICNALPCAMVVRGSPCCLRCAETRFGLKTAAVAAVGAPTEPMARTGALHVGSDTRSEGHQATMGPPIHDLHAPMEDGEKSVAPHDIYPKMHQYADGNGAADYESMEAIRGAHKDRPQSHYDTLTEKYGSEYAERKRTQRQNGDHNVTIYRAAPKGVKTFDTGDWVTPSNTYARGHGKHPDESAKDWPVYKARVPAKHVRWAGDSLNEFGYSGPPVKAEIHFRGGKDAERIKPRTAALSDAMEHTASFWDVQQKAKRIRREGGVEILEMPTDRSPYLYGRVAGDHGTYEVLDERRGSKWGAFTCACRWGDFSKWGPDGRQRAMSSPFLTRRCSHALALAYEYQARGMLGRTPHVGVVSKETPWWQGRTYEESGTPGNKNHITRDVHTWLPTHLVAHKSGVMGESPGEHRNKHGAEWESFKNDIATNGIRNPIFMTCDPGERPKISEGNHRRDAAVELGMPHVPVNIRYFGHAERGDDTEDRAADHFGQIEQLARMGDKDSLGTMRQLHSNPPMLREAAVTAALHEAVSYTGDARFEFEKATPNEMGGTPYHTMRAIPKTGWGGKPGNVLDAIGTLTWHHKTGEVNHIWVHPAHQRQGLASEMWSAAKDHAAATRGVRPPRHSPDRTNDGEAWARSLGERLPRQAAKLNAGPLEPASGDYAAQAETRKKFDKGPETIFGGNSNPEAIAMKKKVHRDLYASILPKMESDPKLMAWAKGKGDPNGAWGPADHGYEHPAEYEGQEDHHVQLGHHIKKTIDGWAGTAGDHDPEAQGLQIALQKHFKLPESTLNHAKTSLGDEGWAKAQKHYEDNKPFLHHFVQSVYDSTQKHLAGQTHLEIHRGVGNSEGPEDAPSWLRPPVAGVRKITDSERRHSYGLNRIRPEHTHMVSYDQPQFGNPRPGRDYGDDWGGGTRKVSMSPGSSWTSSKPIAKQFADRAFAEDQSAVLSARVPRQRVWSTAMTGPGCLGEREAIVLGGKGEVGLRHNGPWADHPTSNPDKFRRLKGRTAVETPEDESHPNIDATHEDWIKRGDFDMDGHPIDPKHLRQPRQAAWAPMPYVPGLNEIGSGHDHQDATPRARLGDRSGRHGLVGGLRRGDLRAEAAAKPPPLNEVTFSRTALGSLRRLEQENSEDHDEVRDRHIGTLTYNAIPRRPIKDGAGSIESPYHVELDGARAGVHELRYDLPSGQSHRVHYQAKRRLDGSFHVHVLAANYHDKSYQDLDTVIGRYRTNRRRAVLAPTAAPEPSWLDREPHVGADGTPHRGVMVALPIPEQVAEALHEQFPEGEEPRDLHCTVAYLGHSDEVDPMALHEAVAATAHLAPATMAISGYGTFEIDPDDNDGYPYVHIGLIDAPGLDAYRAALIEALDSRGLTVSTTHGFTPHVSLQYSHEPLSDPVEGTGAQVPIEAVVGAHSGRWRHYPTGGSMTHEAGADPVPEREESVDHILQHYRPSDADTWDEVKNNLDWDHPKHKAMVEDVRRNGVRRPVPIDYEQKPPQVMNGHTRVLAAHFAGVPTVPTRQHEGFMDPDDPDHLGRQPDDPEHWTNGSSVSDRAAHTATLGRTGDEAGWLSPEGEWTDVDEHSDHVPGGDLARHMDETRNVRVRGVRNELNVQSAHPFTSKQKAVLLQKADRYPKVSFGVSRPDSDSGSRVVHFEQGDSADVDKMLMRAHNRARSHTASWMPMPYVAGMGEAADDEHLTNPHDGTKEWHHGTPHDFKSFNDEPEDEDWDEAPDPEDNPHWNSHLGQHWTSLRDSANKFAQGMKWSSARIQNSGRQVDGQVFTAKLGIRNPKHYADEHQMDHEAFEHNWGHSELDDPDRVHDRHCEKDGCYDLVDHERGDPVESAVKAHYATKGNDERWLRVHPESAEMAGSFKHHLQRQGHDGIVYGNSSYEEGPGPEKHKCAITFDPSQIHDARSRNWREAKSERNTEKPQQCHYCKSPATKSLLWAEGMAYIPACDDHEAKATSDIVDKNNDEVCATHIVRQGSEGSDDPSMDKALSDLVDTIFSHRPSHRPKLSEPAPSPYGGYIHDTPSGHLHVTDESGTRPVSKLYRVVHPKEWQDAQKNGYLQSRGLTAGNGYTRASHRPDMSYLHQSSDPFEIAPKGHVLEIDYSPDDKWHGSAEGYAATHAKIPLSRVRRVAAYLTEERAREAGRQATLSEGSTDEHGNTINMYHPNEIGFLKSRDYAGSLKDLKFMPGGEHDQRVQALKQSMATEGVTKPLEVNSQSGDSYLADGHHRYVAARELGIHVPVIGMYDSVKHGRQAAASGPKAAGIAVRAADTGRVLMLQRALDDSDPASGLFEFPGGHREGSELPREAAEREWEEETGHPLPPGRSGGQWTTANGVYRGFVHHVPTEDHVKVNRPHEDRTVTNPDNPDGEVTETAAWMHPDHIRSNPAVRPEVTETAHQWHPLVSKGPERTAAGGGTVVVHPVNDEIAWA